MSSHASIDLTNEGDETAEDPLLDMEIFGRFRTEVVGVRYYAGYANKNELVRLIREPLNEYDRWAIRVDNMRNEKIGHIRRELASRLSPLMDRDGLTIEGYVQGVKGAYTMPIDVICLGSSSSKAAVCMKLRQGGIDLQEANPEDFVEGTTGGAGMEGTAEGGRLSQSQMDRKLDRLFDEFLDPGAPQAMMNPPSEVLSQLFPHQKVALAWMVDRENSCRLPPFWEARRQGTSNVYVNTLTNFITATRPPALRGGLLADDMGLGKSLVVISLIASNRRGLTPPVPFIGVINGGGATASAAPATGAASQAESASSTIENNKKGGSSGRRKNGRSSKGEQQQEGDSDDEVQIIDPPPQPPKKAKAASRPPRGSAEPSAGCLTQALVSQAEGSRRQLEASLEPAPTPPLASGPRATLVVCPLSVMGGWMQQLEEHTAGGMQVYQYHGPARNRSAAFLSQQDIVITTYATLAQDLNSSSSGSMAVSWLRVVLDEAHTIKNAKSQQSRAAAAVKAERRWAISGTPVQNRLDDLFGLMSFLKLEPLDERIYFTRTLARPIKSNDIRGLMKLQVLMHSIAMRRTKDMLVNGRPLVVLPKKTVQIVKVALDKEDRVKYDRLELEGRRIISHHITQHTLLSNYLSVLEIILRLRQMCDSASLVPEQRLKQLMEDAATGGGSGAAVARPLDAAMMKRLSELMAEGGEDDCSVCLSSFTQPCITRCGHIFCRQCIEMAISRHQPPPCPCPLCRSPISIPELVEPPALTEDDAGRQVREAEAEALKAAGGSYGAKVKALIQQLVANRRLGGEAVGGSSATPRGSVGRIKSVVFSQFLGMMGLVQSALEGEGIPFCRIDGSTSAGTRAEILRAFGGSSKGGSSKGAAAAERATNGGAEVLLVSLKAGGVGMNLTAASHVHLLDPWWNPAVEEQAMDRVHRLGQSSDVTAFRYIASDTIEERMLELQARKRDMASAMFERTRPEDGRQIRIDDVKLLMRL